MRRLAPMLVLLILGQAALAADPFSDWVTDPAGMGQNLLAWWPFDQGAGTTAQDASDHGRDLALQPAAAWDAAGRFGSALKCDGTATSFARDAAGGVYVNGLGAFSVVMWIKSNQTATDRGFFIAMQPDGTDRVLAIRYDADGAWGAGVNVIKAGITTTVVPPDETPEWQIESQSNVQTTNWQHVALTWRSLDAGGDGLLRLYLDGTETGYTYRDDPAGGTIADADRVEVGKGPKDDLGENGTAWDGLVDDVFLFDRALTPAEIGDVMNHTPEPATLALVALGAAAVLSRRRWPGPQKKSGKTS